MPSGWVQTQPLYPTIYRFKAQSGINLNALNFGDHAAPALDASAAIDNDLGHEHRWRRNGVPYPVGRTFLSDRRPTRMSRLLQLRYFTGLSIEDAAEVIGIARSTAYEHWSYARVRLKTLLDRQ